MSKRLIKDFSYAPGGKYKTEEEAHTAAKAYFKLLVTYRPGNARCTHCDRMTPPDDRVLLDIEGDYLCLSCDERLRKELDDFTSNN